MKPETFKVYALVLMLLSMLYGACALVVFGVNLMALESHYYVTTYAWAVAFVLSSVLLRYVYKGFQLTNQLYHDTYNEAIDKATKTCRQLATDMQSFTEDHQAKQGNPHEDETR